MPSPTCTRGIACCAPRASALRVRALSTWRVKSGMFSNRKRPRSCKLGHVHCSKVVLHTPGCNFDIGPELFRGSVIYDLLTWVCQSVKNRHPTMSNYIKEFQKFANFLHSVPQVIIYNFYNWSNSI
jgi:hypothetical protein